MWDIPGGDEDDRLARLRIHLETAQEVADLGSWEADLRSRRLHWSPNTFVIFGWPSSTEPTYEAFLRAVHPADRRHVRRVHDDVIVDAAGEGFTIDHRVVRGDGEVRRIRQEAVVERDDQGTARRLIGFVQDVTDRVELARTLVDTESRRRELLHRLVRASEAARTQLANDLHDGPIQLLAVASMRLQHLGMTEPDPPPWLDGAVEAVRDVIAHLRDVLVELHPGVTSTSGLEATIAHLAATVVPDAEVTVELAGGEPSDEMSRALFGIIQEALWDLRDRRAVEQLRVLVEVDHEGVDLEILEVGEQAAAATARHLVRAGILGVTERTEALGGRCTVERQATSRAIRCRIPRTMEPTVTGGP